MEYLIHHVKFEMRPAYPILFSTVKVRFGHNFSQFISRFKIGTLESWYGLRLYFQVFSQLTKRSENGIFKCCSGWASQFFTIHGRN